MALVNRSDESVLISFDPATGKEVGRVAVSSPSEVKDVVERSRTAFGLWQHTSFDERRSLIMKARELILADIDGIAELISRESGKPFGEAIAMEIVPVLDLMQHYARHTKYELKPRRISIGLYSLLGRRSRIIYKPWGVIGIIPAWNYPFTIPLGEAVMALMCGNSVVIKPSELTPLTGLKIGEIFETAGAPDDLVQIICGSAETGEALVDAHPDKIQFTGSVGVGKKIAAKAAETLTPVVLELGGKDPMIVFDDADIELAARGAVWGAFCNSGQSCSSVERLYVQKAIATQLTDRIVELTKGLKQGNGLREDVSLGAMSSQRQLDLVKKHIENFRDSGAEILTGGKSSGLFFEPTVIAGATNDMQGMRDETFGPTLPICVFETENDAIALANDCEFGLTASVWTKDHAKAKRVAEQIDAGTVCINEVLYTHGIAQTPWGGVKNSGLGRTHGREGLLELVRPQHIHTNRFALLPDAWWMPYSSTAVKTFRDLAAKFASGSLIRTTTMLPRLWKRLRELKKDRT